MDLLVDFWAWAWPRHLNILSWYIRPLFFLPLAYFSYRRSRKGIVLTLLALLTSFFWFPAPEVVDPRVRGVLDMEREYMTNLSPAHVLFLLTAPLGLFAFCFAFWRRSLGWGLVLVNVAVVGKMVWVFANAGSDGLATLAPVGGGLVVIDAVVLLVAYRFGLRVSLRGTDRSEERGANA